MGFGDERGRHLDELREPARHLAEQMYPRDMAVVPGGSYAEWHRKRELAAEAGPAIIARLAADGLIDEEAVKLKYGGEN